MFQLRFCFIFCIIISFISCERSKVEPADVDCVSLFGNDQVTYESHLKEVLDLTCAYSGCHVPGASFPNMENYSDMQGSLLNGDIFRRSVTVGDMPTSMGDPDSLTLEQINLVICWANGNYPEF